MTNEIIISPVKDEKMNSHLNESKVWEKAYTLEEWTDKVRGMHPAWWKYHIKFNGLIPIQMTKFKKL